MFEMFLRNKISLSVIIAVSAFMTSCAVEAAQTADPAVSEKYTVRADQNASSKNGTIDVAEDSPAGTIRTFYRNLRENRFREAIFLTNLRPAIEGLTDQELKDLQVDFSNLAEIIPGEIQISGEIISGTSATVMAKLPDNAAGKIELKEFKLVKQNGGWLILMVDGEQEAEIKKQGKNYFFSLRIDVHHSEVEKMMDRIYKAQVVFSLQNGGEFTGFKSLIEKNLLPDDVRNPDFTGYIYNLSLSADKKQYTVTAEPADYGKTGKFSYLLKVERDKKPVLKQEDKRGKSLKS